MVKFQVACRKKKKKPPTKTEATGMCQWSHVRRLLETAARDPIDKKTG